MNKRDLNIQGVHRAVFGGQVQITERAGEDGGEPVKIYTFVASTEQPARDGHILLQNWDLANFAANPVILYGHDHDTVIGRASKIYVEQTEHGRALMVDIEFDEANPDGKIQRVIHQVQQGFLRAVSVGWITNSAKRRSSYPGDSPHYEEDGWGYVIGEEENSELLEISIVSVPAQASALKRTGDTARQLTEAEIRAIVRDERVNGDAPEADGFPSGFFPST